MAQFNRYTSIEPILLLERQLRKTISIYENKAKMTIARLKLYFVMNDFVADKSIRRPLEVGRGLVSKFWAAVIFYLLACDVK